MHEDPIDEYGANVGNVWTWRARSRSSVTGTGVGDNTTGGHETRTSVFE